MEKMHEMDDKIRKALLYKANLIEPSEDIYKEILGGVKERKNRPWILRYEKYLVASMFIVVLLFGVAFNLPASSRVSAGELINLVKSVFIIDKDNKVVEKAGNYDFLQPAYSKDTKLSDVELSKKMGVRVSFPDNFYADYHLTYKGEAVGFTKSMDYETYRSLEKKTVKAIDNVEVFNSLKEYRPWRSVGGIYKNKKGTTVYLAIFNTKVSLPPVNINITDTVQTKVGQLNAQFLSLSFPEYNEGDLTQRPMKLNVAKLLLWSSDKTTYIILLKEHSPLSVAESVKIAESFMKAQK